MRKKETNRVIVSFFVLAALTALLLLLNLCVGSVKIGAGEVFAALFNRRGDALSRSIVWEIRFPRALAALFLGGALSLSGYLLQTFFHNPIAGPFVLGISSGAKLTVSIALIFFAGNLTRVSSISLIFAAFLGAVLAMGFVLLVSARVERMSLLIVAGVMVGYICSAVTDLLITFADDADIVNLHNWSRGSFSGMNWTNVATCAVFTVLVSALVFLLSKPLSAFQTGESYAAHLGVNVRLLRTLLVLLSSLLAAIVTAFAGPISFVGIAVPHLTRTLFRTAKPIVLIPGCFLGGSVFCLFSDLLARNLFSPTELSISTVTALFGAPVVIRVMLKRRKERDV